MPFSGYAVSLHDGINIRGLVQLIERNKERGLLLADGNARMDGDQVVYSVVYYEFLYRAVLVLYTWIDASSTQHRPLSM